ncbi:MAG: flippase-like domain-containing protein [Methanoregula sp.]|nr:flippase-like domain-containing protein [Methanoregula sp.]
MPVNHNNFFKKILIYAGFFISAILILIILSKIDWNLFFSTISQLNPYWLIVSSVLILIGVFVRSLRWNIVTMYPTGNIRQFWKAVNLGYLGNLVYPARAGEIIRIVALKRFIEIPEGLAVASSIIDRLADGIMIPLFIVLIVEYLGKTIEIPFAIYFLAFFFVIFSLFLVSFIIWGKKSEEALVCRLGWIPQQWLGRISQWYISAHEGASALKNPLRFSEVFSLSIIAFVLDSAAYYTLFFAFGWILPVVASILVCIFIFAGSALPSTPGYFGIYQVACILALQPFGINGTVAVAYSLVLQCIVYIIFLSTGGWIIIKTGFSLKKVQTETDCG